MDKACKHGMTVEVHDDTWIQAQNMNVIIILIIFYFDLLRYRSSLVKFRRH